MSFAYPGFTHCEKCGHTLSMNEAGLCERCKEKILEEEQKMDKWRIEIWRYWSIEDIYESDNSYDILQWYRKNWLYTYENGGCSFSVYKNDEKLKFKEEARLGFYVDYDEVMGPILEKEREELERKQKMKDDCYICKELKEKRKVSLFSIPLYIYSY